MLKALLQNLQPPPLRAHSNSLVFLFPLPHCALVLTFQMSSPFGNRAVPHLQRSFTYYEIGVRNTQENGSVNEDNRANSESPQNNASCSKIVKNIKIYSPTPEITPGANVTLVCYWETDCVPINYILFLNQRKVQGPAPQSTKEQKVVFNTTIHSDSQLGPYKCKTDKRYGAAYSPGFNFTLRATEKNNLAVFIVPPLVLLLLLIAAVVTIRLLILPWCKARKLKSANICTAYDDTGENQLDNEHYVDYGITEENEYCNLKMKTEIDYRYVNNGEDSTVTYAEVIL